MRREVKPFTETQIGRNKSKLRPTFGSLLVARVWQARCSVCACFVATTTTCACVRKLCLYSSRETETEIESL